MTLEYTKGDGVKYIEEGSSLIPKLILDGWKLKKEAKKEAKKEVKEEVKEEAQEEKPKKANGKKPKD